MTGSDSHDGLGRSLLGWWPDPTGRHEYRYHNGVAWTADVADGGDRFVDPLGADPPGRGPRAGSPAGRNGAATVSLVFGIVGAAIGLIPFVFVVGAVAAIVALATGWIGLRRAGDRGVGRSKAITGLVTGALGLTAAVGGAILTVVLVDALDRYEDPGAHELGEVRCVADGRSWTAGGTITNLEDDARGYTLTVEFRRAGTDNAATRTRIELEDVAPGETRTFETRRAVDLDEVDCAVTDVDGPAPFGIDLGG